MAEESRLKIKTEIMDEKAMTRAVARITYEILERNHGAENLCIVGIRRRGAVLAKMISDKISEIEGTHIDTCTIDITPFRDDRKAGGFSCESEIPFDITGRRVVVADDVIYTGRSARAAIEAVMHRGRPALLQLAVLIDRGHRELPIRPDFVGKNVPTSHAESIAVMVTEYDGANRVVICEKSPAAGEKGAERHG